MRHLTPQKHGYLRRHVREAIVADGIVWLEHVEAPRPPEGSGLHAPVAAATEAGSPRQAAATRRSPMNAPLPVRTHRGAVCIAAPLLAIAVALLPSLRLAHGATPRDLLARVEQVSDGNSLVAVSEDGTKLRIQLLGIDAPDVPHGKQPGQPFGEEARDHLTRLIGARTVRVVPYGREGSDRIQAVVFLGPTNVNVEMVERGLAEVSRRTACQAYCRDLRVAELKARRDRLGKWMQGRTAGARQPSDGG